MKILLDNSPVRLAYQSPANSIFISEHISISHQQTNRPNNVLNVNNVE
jgi:hypothetical protein